MHKPWLLLMQQTQHQAYALHNKSGEAWGSVQALPALLSVCCLSAGLLGFATHQR